jgi:hypothetical protein
MPPLISGNVMRGPVSQAEAQNETNTLYPAFTEIAMARGQAGMVGSGVNTYSVVDNNECTLPLPPILIIKPPK